MTYHSTEIGELAKALSAFQGKLEGVEKDSKNPFFKSKYASLDAIWSVIRQPLSENQLAISQAPLYIDGKDFLETLLMHSSGQWRSSLMHVRTSKPDVQALGGSLTYSERYALCGILGISSYDDDGEEAMKHVRAEKPKEEEKGSTIDDLAKGMLEFSKEEISEYVAYIAHKSNMTVSDVVSKCMSSDVSFNSFRDKLKASIDKKKQPT
jgi:hypothetical protein